MKSALIARRSVYAAGCYFLLAVASALPAFAASIALENPSQSEASIKFIRLAGKAGDAPVVKTIKPGKRASLSAYDGGYVLMVRYGNAGKYTYAKTPMIRVPIEIEVDSRYAYSLKLAGGEVAAPWETVSEGDYNQAATGRTAEKPLDTIMAAVSAMSFTPGDSSFNSRLACAAAETALFVDILGAAQEIKDPSDRKAAVKTLSDFLSRCSSKQTFTVHEITVAKRAIKALVQFSDVRPDVEATLLQLSKHKEGAISSEASKALNEIKTLTPKQPVDGAH